MSIQHFSTFKVQGPEELLNVTGTGLSFQQQGINDTHGAIDIAATPATVGHFEFPASVGTTGPKSGLMTAGTLGFKQRITTWPPIGTGRMFIANLLSDTASSIIRLSYTATQVRVNFDGINNLDIVLGPNDTVHDWQISWDATPQQCIVRLDGQEIFNASGNAAMTNISQMRMGHDTTSTITASYLLDEVWVDNAAQAFRDNPMVTVLEPLSEVETGWTTGP